MTKTETAYTCPTCLALAITTEVYQAIAAAPPQTEPADHLAEPDSRERATNAAATQADDPKGGNVNAPSAAGGLTPPAASAAASDNAEKWCNWCRTDTHNNADCWSTRPIPAAHYYGKAPVHKYAPAPASNLPLSAEQVTDTVYVLDRLLPRTWDEDRERLKHLGNQALRAIALKEQVADKDAEIAQIKEAYDELDARSIVTEDRAEKAEAECKEKDKKIEWFKDKHAKAVDHTFSLGNRLDAAEAELAELRARVK